MFLDPSPNTKKLDWTLVSLYPELTVFYYFVISEWWKSNAKNIHTV